LAALNRVGAKTPSVRTDSPAGTDEDAAIARNAKAVLSLRSKELMTAAARSMKEGKSEEALGGVCELFQLLQHSSAVKHETELETGRNYVAVSWSKDADIVDDGMQILGATLKQMGIATLAAVEQASVLPPGSGDSLHWQAGNNADVDFAGYVEKVLVRRGPTGRGIETLGWVLLMTQQSGRARPVLLDGDMLATIPVLPHDLEGKVVRIRGTKTFNHFSGDLLIEVKDEKALSILGPSGSMEDKLSPK
jgi:hypothetical protein